MDSLCLKTGMHVAAIPVGGSCGALEGRVSCSSSLSHAQQVSAVASGNNQKKTMPFRFSFKFPLQSLWAPRFEERQKKHNGLALDDAVLVEEAPTECQVGPKENWVLKILHTRSFWKERDRTGNVNGDNNYNNNNNSSSSSNSNNDNKENDDEVAVEKEEEKRECCEGRKVDDDGGEEEEKGMEFDRESFSKLLKKASLAEAKLYAQMSYLGNLAYCIPRMKAGNLLRRHGLHFVTSSIDKRELAKKAEKKDVVAEDQEVETSHQKDEEEGKEQKNDGYRISAPAAYHVAASAASYLLSHTKSILPFKSSNSDSKSASSLESGNVNDGNVDMMNAEMASLMATTDSVTAVVAAKEEVKQAVADDLKSTRSFPCEWFICDDEQGTRYFVIQGSETLASWKANLLFEPVQFEGLDVPVHRGIYEAAKGMYEQMLPEVHSHLKLWGNCAAFRFTGHSLGGSLSLLLNLMLLMRGEVPASSLLPVITFGSPSVMCGGDHLLRKLGLPRSHIQSITLHRDIVPRAFSCTYPNHVAELLKAVNGNFRNHPCLDNQNLLYAPVGELLILQPDEKFSPHHHLLPEGTGLYFLTCPLSDAVEAEKQLRAAQMVFLNSPHPLEILSDHSAYGSGGTIQRDHDMNSYLRSVRNVIRQELNRIRKSRRDHRRKFWWSVLDPRGANGVGIVIGRPVVTIRIGQNRFNFSGVLQTGRESLKRFSRLVTSQHVHLFVVLLFPARLLLVGAYSLISFR